MNKTVMDLLKKLIFMPEYRKQLELELSWCSACLVHTVPLVRSHALHKSGVEGWHMLVIPALRRPEAGESNIYDKFEGSLGHMGPHLKNK